MNSSALPALRLIESSEWSSASTDPWTPVGKTFANGAFVGGRDGPSLALVAMDRGQFTR